MRIMQVNASYPEWGGTEFFIVRLASALKEAGHETLIACRKGSLTEEFCLQHEIAARPLSISGHNDFRQLPHVLRILREFRPDVVNVHIRRDMRVVGIAAKMAKVPVRICTIHLPFRSTRTSSLRYVSSLYDRIIMVSQAMERAGINIHIPKEKLRVIYPGVDIARFDNLEPKQSARSRLELPQDDFLAVLVGRVCADKGHHVMLDALAQLKERGAKVTAVFVGEGEKLSLFQEKGRRLGLEDQLIWRGFQMNVADYMRASDVVCVPSDWFDPFPLVKMEAMASSRPVIVSDKGGLPEGVEHGVNGFIIRAGDPTGLAAGLEKLEQDPLLCCTMGRAGKETVCARFTQSHTVEQTLSLYQEVLSGRK